MLFDDLKERGLVCQQTSEDIARIFQKPVTFYCGVDPTSDSLHVGSMLPLITMRRLQLEGHTPIVVLGGATGMIGDPGGKSKERNLLDEETIQKNLAGVRRNVEKILDFTGSNAAKIVNNADWIRPLNVIEFLRDIGKHFSINYMMGKDSVKTRIDNPEQGISFTEFSYMLIQAYDFYHLHKTQNCRLQIGGSDQWGNITAGTELIRRKQGEGSDKEEAYGFTFPLITKADGSKFGKTESGNVWLSADRTSPYQFYQFFLRLPDDEAVKLLRLMSLKPMNEIQELEAQMKSAPQERAAQLSLAHELTTMIHGKEELQRVEHASQVLFSGKLQELDQKTLVEVFSEAPSVQLTKDKLQDMTLVDLLVESKLCSSKGAARKDLKAGAVYLNNQKVEGGEDLPGKDLPLLHGAVIVLRRGKKNYCLAQFS